MEQTVEKSIRDPEKWKFVYGNEKMNEEQNKNIEPTEITKLKTGYDQHASLQFPYTTLQRNRTTSSAHF